MAANFASNVAEKVMGHGDPSVTPDVANPSIDKSKYADPSGEKMQALAWFGKNDVRMVETFKPKVVDGRDVILKVTGSTICGSDRHLYHGSIIQLQKGDILGHEFMGIVDSVGPAVRGIAVGDRAVASFQIACGDCQFCKQKLSSMCEKTNASTVENMMYGNRTAGMFGYSHFTGGFAGGQAEYVRVPYGDVNLLKIPQGVSDEKALYLSDVLCTSYHCVVDTGVEKGDTVAVWGLGAVGLLACMWAFEKGASRVIGVDNNWRLDYAKSKLPKLELLNFDEAKKGVSVAINEMVPSGVDVALECASGEFVKGYLHTVEMALNLETDTSEIANEMILSVKPFGKCGITGIYAGFTNHFNIGAIMEKGVRFIGNGQAPVHMYWEMILNDYIIPGKIDPLMVMTHRIDISDVAKAYRKFDNQEMGIEKVFVQTKFSSPPSAGAPQLTKID